MSIAAIGGIVAAVAGALVALYPVFRLLVKRTPTPVDDEVLEDVEKAAEVAQEIAGDVVRGGK